MKIEPVDFRLFRGWRDAIDLAFGTLPLLAMAGLCGLEHNWLALCASMLATVMAASLFGWKRVSEGWKALYRQSDAWNDELFAKLMERGETKPD